LFYKLCNYRYLFCKLCNYCYLLFYKLCNYRYLLFYKLCNYRYLLFYKSHLLSILFSVPLIIGTLSQNERPKQGITIVCIY